MRNSSWVLYSALAILATACGDGNQDELMDGNGKVPVESEEIGQAKQAVEYNGHDYLFVVTARNWDDAQAYCRQYGYDLVTINDANEENWLHAQENSRSGNHWWMGYTDRGFEGSWRWISGLPSTYANWSPENPNNYSGQQHCGTDNWDSAGRWDDDYCWFSFPFVCESSGSPNKGHFSYSAANTASATQNTTNYPIQLYQGMVLTFGTCGVSGAGGSGDTYLRLLNPQGSEVAANDDACGYLSNLSYVVPSTGTYYIRAGCYSSGSCSGTVAFNY